MSAIFGLLHHYFIPGEHNDHKPHILRTGAVIVVACLILLIEVAFIFDVLVVVPHTSYFATILTNVIVDRTNTNRLEERLPGLTISPLLKKAARLKAKDMAEKGYFSHNGPDGAAPWAWLENVGYDFVSAGENLAVHFIDSSDVVAAWMNSPSHRANILNGRYTEIGVAAATGNYNGKEGIFVVQFFGRPAVEIVKAPAPPIAPSVRREVPPPTKIIETTSSIAKEVEESSTTVLGEEIKKSPPKYASTIQRIASSPKMTTAQVYVALLVFVVAALALKVFIKIRIQHPRLIVNGLILIALIISALAINQYLIGGAELVSRAYY